MTTPFSITIFSTTGDPEGIRHVDKSNWSGFGVVFPKEKLNELKDDPSFKQAGIYLLIGNAAEETVYIGEADPVGDRLKNHVANKEGWVWGVYFVDKNQKIGKTEVQYLEYELIQLAKKSKRAILLNKNNVTSPTMSSIAKATAQAFLADMLLILPMLNITAFSEIKNSNVIQDEIQPISNKTSESESFDTVVVPAREEGFKKVFLGENCWFSIRINSKHIPKLKYIAAYQVAPIAALTHIAEIASIVPYENTGKYLVKFKTGATKIEPITRPDDSKITMQAPRYALRANILKATNLDKIWQK
jgi:hypothetical protein